MELIIKAPTEDGFIKAIEWNHEEIMEELKDKVAMYGCMVYDENQIKEAKADRAELNKFKKALEDKRKEVKAKCLAPYESFEKKMKEIVAIIDEPVQMIDAQVKEFEAQQKLQKQEEIKAYFATKEFHGFQYEDIEDPKWLNAGTSMKSICEAIDTEASNIEADMQIINDLPEYSFEALEVYKRSRDVRTALGEAKRLTELAKAKEEWEARKAAAEAEEKATPAPEPIPEPVVDQEPEKIETDDDWLPNFDEMPNNRTWLAYKAFMTPEDEEALEWFLNSRSVPFEKL